MSEKINVTPEITAEIERAIELNKFCQNEISEVNVEQFDSKNLLPVKDYEKEKELSLIREEFLKRFSIEQITEAILKESFIIRDYGVIEIDIETDLPDLPEGYGYKGGVARSKLRDALRLPAIKPRDIDLIRLSQNELHEGLDKNLAKKYMEQDFEFGDGVEVVTDTEYMSTRDFTINEVYVEKNKIFVTEQCIRDTLLNIIRVTDFERERYQSDSQKLGPKMKAKALRFHTEQMFATGTSSIPADDKNEIENSFINPFWLSVQLDRCFERSEEVADKFTSTLKEYQIIPQGIKDSLDLGNYLLEEVYDFRFRNAPKLQFRFEEDFAETADLTKTDILEDYLDTLYNGSRY